ncbi:KH domain-containing, RNA-binding, signal transduction-associated protein 2-like [Musca vetustissima]|uniref:KH domain-containing, RNA-binding, signal transduction-associated protein 2-like n=1 Tax=Musca vetustissima TaxID=27455 RepID=UPI002AB6FD96|nr:KH domain-containing, RNA-binding, signal transduction-associated protein 2-like [Musca vetustissima]
MSYDNEKHNSDGYVPKINQYAQEYIEALRKEEARLPKEFPLCAELIRDAMDRIYATGRTPGKELKADVFQQKPIKLTQNVYLPVKQYPKFNFQGKILGPKGNTLKRLHQETLCSIAIKGRNSMRDQEREEMLRQSGDPAYNHLNKNLFVEISTVAPPAEAHARMAYALTEIRKYIIPDKNDEISQEQYRELMEIDPKLVKSTFGIKTAPQKSVFQKLAALSQKEYHDDADQSNGHNFPGTKDGHNGQESLSERL